MEFLDEGVERKVFDFEVEMDDRERMILFEHARKEMSEEEFEGMMINWAMVNLLEKKIEEALNTLPEEDK